MIASSGRVPRSLLPDSRDPMTFKLTHYRHQLSLHFVK